MRPEWRRAASVAVVGLALALRLPRAVLRWDEVALAYAAYAEPAVRALEAGDAVGLAASWVGLHPPLHAGLMALSELSVPVPALWLLFSVLASTAAVAAVCRVAGPVAGLVLATAPMQLAYAAEVNNYPLTVGAVGLLLLAARARWGWLVAAAALACQAHLLGAAAAGGVVLWRLLHPVDAAERPRLAAGAALVALPVVVGAARLLGQDTTFIQPAAEPGAWLEAAGGALGAPGVALAVIGLFGLRGPALSAFLPAAGLLAASLLSNAAAPHQLPYLAILGVPLAAGVAGAVARAGGGGPGVAVLVAVVALGLGGKGAHDAFGAVSALLAAQAEPRGVDRALAQAAPGDVVWLVAPALQADDDKSDTSAVLWRIPPWTPMPRAMRVPFEYRDWRYGQPRTVAGVDLHTSTELDAAAFDHVAVSALGAGADVWVVLYDHAPATGLEDRLARALRPYARTHVALPTHGGLGDDHVWHLSGRAP
jgi:hypothetical protein